MQTNGFLVLLFLSDYPMASFHWDIMYQSSSS